MSGTMNDFIIIDNRDDILKLGFAETYDANHFPNNWKDSIVKLCARKYSIGADGIILIESSNKADFKWHYFNCDGSEAEMCGNGARCAARFAFLEGIAGPALSFETKAGIIHAEVRNNLVKVRMTEPSEIKCDIQLSTGGGSVTLSKINTGVPHAVIPTENLDEFTLQTLKNLGATVRYHKYFQPAGANVNFIESMGPDSLKVKTYERGVEDITHACGTGVVASTLVAHAKKMVTSNVVKIKTMGGDLTVYFDVAGKKYTNVYLEGDARVICRGELTDESI